MSDLARLPPAVLWSLGGIFTLLVIASGASIALKENRPDRDFTELGQRIRTWWILVTIFTVAIVLNRTISMGFFAFVSFLALKEYFTVIPTRRVDRRVLFWAYLAIPLQYYWTWSAWYGMFIIFIPVYVTLLVQVRMVLIGQTEGFLRSVGTIHWGLMTAVFSLSHAAYLLVLDSPVASEAPPGPGLLIYLVGLTQLNDIAQYLWGKSLGGPKVTPQVSPAKTWAGFLGGVATTVALGATLGPLLTPLDWLSGLLAGLVIGAGGFFGDLTISCLKRDLGIKDSGSLLPGHGGILDRVDSLTYTAPLFFHLVYWMYF